MVNISYTFEISASAAFGNDVFCPVVVIGIAIKDTRRCVVVVGVVARPSSVLTIVSGHEVFSIQKLTKLTNWVDVEPLLASLTPEVYDLDANAPQFLVNIVYFTIVVLRRRWRLWFRW